MAEILHRISDSLLIQKLKANPNSYKKDLVRDLQKAANHTLKFPKLSCSVKSVLHTQLENGKEFTLGEKRSVLSTFEDTWREIPFSEIKQKNTDPDIRAVWEPARLQHLMILLHHLSTNRNQEQKNSIEELIQARLFWWIIHNPFLHGPHYTSVMECALRIPVFFAAYLNLKQLSSNQQHTLLLTIFQHSWLIRKRLSLYSSLGNHTISECVGLIIAGALFKKTDQGTEWLQTGIRLLEQECNHQILDDGGPAEQSFSYHRFVLDLYWLAIHFLTDNNLHDCSSMRKRVLVGETFLQTIQYKDESLPMIGDSDDGFAVAPGLSPVREVLNATNQPLPYKNFPNSGYSLFRGENGLRILFDHGSLGMAPLYNHGHADCLSILISFQHIDFLIDPGTFQYNGNQQLRRYFKSTKAHNTVSVDGFSQAKHLSSFMWDRSFEVSWEAKIVNKNNIIASGKHNGFTLQDIAVSHCRTLTFNPTGTLTIEDTFSGSGKHEYTLHFHLHPAVTVSRKNKTILLQRENITMSLTINAETINLLHGKNEPLAGWYSRSYGSIEPTTTIQAVKHGTPENTFFKTSIVML